MVRITITQVLGIREIFSGEIRDFRPSGVGGLSAVFCKGVKWIDMIEFRKTL